MLFDLGETAAFGYVFVLWYESCDLTLHLFAKYLAPSKE